MTNTIVLNDLQYILCTYHIVNELKKRSNVKDTRNKPIPRSASSTFAPITRHVLLSMRPSPMSKQQQIEIFCKNQKWTINWATPIPTMITHNNIANYTRRQTILFDPTDQLPSVQREKKAGTFTSIAFLV